MKKYISAMARPKLPSTVLVKVMKKIDKKFELTIDYADVAEGFSALYPRELFKAFHKDIPELGELFGEHTSYDNYTCYYLQGETINQIHIEVFSVLHPSRVSLILNDTDMNGDKELWDKYYKLFGRPSMGKEKAAKLLIALLEKHRFYDYELEDLLGDNPPDYLWLGGKAYGDSYECYAEEYFGEDYDELKFLCEALGIDCPEIIDFD